MPNAVELGVHGIQVALGDHVCGLYAGETQRDQVILPFLEAGLRHGDKCICIVDGVEPSEIVDGLCPGGDDWPGVDNQLDVMRASDVYLRSGLFSAPEIISSWKAAISEVMYDGRFDVVRAVEVCRGGMWCPTRRSCSPSSRR